ncbi:MAG TPA: methionyl-tRNA formyltransferase [Planctomycetota bacterium]|jgi:methionyl-tRNA formyltransferase|nr:methionyl-tRNA formyltransferase [Planctomycetota bacterium]OQC19015.1 MAG: Methionyl-tRNA formyltransferase [Planctomycetes bacterium ADurb.Bin069]HNS00719.1 methionyl-tRNA formyltransferase [Planctomycetota bacterium]HNU26925.1 methionyl-tRNA formyltransferase [Planctomycetota bacterium]HOE30712.1 methionyl-tRNA formyltransferase [Planctomycetota bacterium]
MRIAFAGAGAFAIEPFRMLHALGSRLVMVVTRPDRPKGRGRRVAATPIAEEAQRVGFPVAKVARIAALADTLVYLQIDLLLVADFGELIPEAVLAIPRIGPFNLHASLLPRWRGAAPCPRTILAGDAASGVTFFRMTKEMDAGPILAQREAPVLADDTSATLEARLSAHAAALLAEALPRLEAGDFTLRGQDTTGITFAPKLTKLDGAVPWHLEAAAVLRHVRAMQPWPRAYAFLQSPGRPPLRVNLIEARAVDAPAAPPGVIVAVGEDCFDVACAAGAVRVLRLQAAGKRVMTCGEFLRGNRLTPGDRLAPEAGDASPPLEA